MNFQSSVVPDPLAAALHNDDNFPKLNCATLSDVARSYTNTIEDVCVPLEKISDTSNVLEETSHPLHATEISALQWHLTPPDDDDTPVFAAISLTLPRELVEHILLLLDTKSIYKCRLVNREFNTVIQSSTLVQYYLACKAAGVADNSRSPLSYAERLKVLKAREDAWRKLKPVFETTIKFDYQTSTLYELTAGNYFRTHKNRKDLYYCSLPSSIQDNPRWFMIPGHGTGQSWSGSIIEIGMAIYEHDLVVNVISSEIGNQVDMQHSVDLVLLKLSTREYHPLARHPLIHVQRSLSARPHTSVKIVGDHLVLVVGDEDGSKLFIFDWKTGRKRLQHKAIGNAYEWTTPVFVSPELLLVPNRVQSCFEVWYLFTSHPKQNSPIQILSLKIPAVSDDYSIISLRCHGGLSPFLHSMPYFPPRPFFSSPENSIITINLRLDCIPSGLPKRYKLIMHRHALLDVVQKWTSPLLLEQNEGLPTWLTNEVTVHEVADPDEGLMRLGAQSELISMTPHPGFPPHSPSFTTSQTSSTSYMFADSSSSIPSGSASSTSRYNTLQVQWADWGPPISRWFQLNGAYESRTMQCAGQRCVFLDPNPHDESKSMVSVADFNLHNVRENAEMMAQPRRGQSEGNDGNGNNREGRTEENEELEALDHEGVFSEEVYMGLKCVVYKAPVEYNFEVVLMDDERLLGLTTKFANGNREIKVLYFG